MPDQGLPAGGITRRAQVDDYLDHLTLFGIKLGLDTVRALLDALGDPHTRYPAIHIAGTNGKGSCAAFLDALLGGYGLCVGRYTSPHLVDFSERITVAGRPIADADLVLLAGRVAAAARPLPQPPTFFEVGTVLALAHFAQANGGAPVDAAVVEVGMGGRLDATNVLTPAVCVITNVDLEHTAYLGTTVDQVAREKAGIIKPGVPVVTGARGVALAVIRERARELGAPLYVLGRDFGTTRAHRFSYHGIRTNYHGLTLGMVGAHQRGNAALALAALELFFPRGVAAAEPVVAKALAGATWAGRLERVVEHPPVVLDCAHNPAGAEVLGRHLAGHPHPGPLWLVLGVLADKDLDGIVAPLAPHAAHVILTAPASDRAGQPAEQARVVARRHGEVRAVPGVAAAVERAMAEARDAGGWVCVAGSVYTVGEARAHLLGPRGAA
ncbi:MAG: bifunctional folylpolyglutamate synthase/dihydrofolate synthase [Nitrospirae bacterium]|nr:bifunctional folylpolyglutamate synthase/dihydrofolate synthase [Nitrospirota bacterium]